MLANKFQYIIYNYDKYFSLKVFLKNVLMTGYWFKYTEKSRGEVVAFWGILFAVLPTRVWHKAVWVGIWCLNKETLAQLVLAMATSLTMQT